MKDFDFSNVISSWSKAAKDLNIEIKTPITLKDKNGNKILYEMSKVTGLKWPRNFIECTVAFYAPWGGFSSPLTLTIDKDIKYEIETLVHELSHVLTWGNRKKVLWPESNSGIYKKYKNETFNAKLHFPIHAIVTLVFKKIFREHADEYLKYEHKWYSPRSKDYISSWEIVEKEGPEKILKELIKR